MAKIKFAKLVHLVGLITSIKKYDQGLNVAT